jgi:thiol-disulfide isomerase/thioredoxin
MKKKLMAFVLMAGLFAPVVAIAQDKENPNEEEPKITLRVGDPAPALTPGKWIKGEPVKAFEKGKIYIVEFWATWCPPCRASIPHLTELQAKYKDKGVIVIGQNVSDRQEKVPEFVEKMGDKMNYRVALDDVSKDKEGAMNTAWMEASGQAGIPTSFVVGKDGKIVWIGHPSQLDSVLERVIAGTYDPAKQAELMAKQKKLEEQLGESLSKRDFDKALTLADELAALSPQMAKDVVGLKFQIHLDKKEYDTAYKFGAQLLELYKDEPQILNAIAWTILTEDSIEKRDLNLAEKMSLRSAELTKGDVGSVLDTVAKVYALKGDFAKAVEWQTKAVAKFEDEDDKKEAQTTLDEYKAKSEKK